MKDDQKPADQKTAGKKQPTVSTSRRKLFKNAGVAAVGLVAGPELLMSSVAQADSRQPGNVPKSAVQYQDHPKGNEKCSNCQAFIPGPNPSAKGHCTIVRGKVSPKAWCNAWSKASS